MDKPVIFIFIGGYLPGKKYGGPVTSIENFVNHLCNKYEMRIVCNDHDFNETEKYPGIKLGWNPLGNALAWFLNEKDYSVSTFYELMKPFSDRIVCVYLSGIYYFRMNDAAIMAAKKLSIPVISAPRGDLMKNSIAMKGMISRFKKEIFLAITRASKLYDGVFIQATSEEEAYGAEKYLNIDRNRIFTIPNLPVSPVKYQKRQKEKNVLHLLSMSRIMVKKNILDTIKAIGLVSEQFTVAMDIYGPIESQEYWDECLKTINEISSDKKIIQYRGALAPDEAKAVYRKYECFAFPTLSENYGHTIAESLLSDCPVLLTRGTTPWDEYAENGVYLCDLHDVHGLAGLIERFAGMDEDEYERELLKNREYIQKTLKIDDQVKQYINMIEKIRK